MSKLKLVTTLLTLLLGASFLYPSAAATSPWALYQAAQAAEQSGDWTRAATLYQEAAVAQVASSPVNAALMYGHAGRMFAKSERYDDAGAAWQQEAQFWRQTNSLQESIAAERKANWVRSEVRLFVTSPAEAIADRYYTAAKFEPKTGALLGVYAEMDPLVHDPQDADPLFTLDFEIATGRQHPIFLLYANWGDPFPSGLAQRIKAVGGALQWALQPSKGLVAVQDDAYLREIALAAKAAEIPVFLRFGGEMNGDWVPWHGDPTLYKAKFRLVANRFRAEAPNVAMVWAPGYFPLYTMADYYPGDDLVDWVGISAYGVFDPSLDPVALPGKGEDSRNISETFGEVYRLYADRKPIMLAEGAIGYFNYATNQANTTWAMVNIQRFYAAMPRLYPRVKALTWFDVDLGTTPSHDEGIMVQNYRLTGNPEILQTYRRATADPYYLSALDEQAEHVFLELTEFGAPPYPVELSSYVKAYDPYLARVQYAIGDRIIGSSTAGDPWKVTADFSPYAGQAVTVTVRAYDRAGKLAVQRQIPVRVGSAQVRLDGQRIAFDYQPRIVGGAMLVPIRAIATATGASISVQSGRVIVERDGHRISLQPGSPVAHVDGQAVTLNAAPVVENGRTLVPLRMLESLGLTVTWDQATRTAQLK
ncbi:MAG TPA: stalk domain-containing protein [Symbiobacteriaceae bacterium]|nr:stalk domain-containing protein [Symbiobacteriaceae bacterium]